VWLWIETIRKYPDCFKNIVSTIHRCSPRFQYFAPERITCRDDNKSWHAGNVSILNPLKRYYDWSGNAVRVIAHFQACWNVIHVHPEKSKQYSIYCLLHLLLTVFIVYLSGFSIMAHCQEPEWLSNIWFTWNP